MYEINKGLPRKITGIFRKFMSDQYFKKVLTKLRNKRVVNVGCGERDYKEYLHGSNTIINTDLRQLPNVDIVCNANNLPFEDESVDFIICLNLLEHVKHPKKVINEIHRVLKPNARMLLHSPFLYPEHDVPNDYHRWTTYGLKQLLKNFEILDIHKSYLIHPKFTIGISVVANKNSTGSIREGSIPSTVKGGEERRR